MSNQIEAPLALYTTVVQSEWLDYNQHMTEGFYGVVFGYTSDAFIDYIGLDADYRARSGCTIYTVETHTSFLREVKAASPLRLTTQLLGYDVKRLHVFHQMYQVEENYLAATMEAMMLHVNQEPRTVPMPSEILAHLATIYEAHTITLPRPPQAGSAISMPQK